METKNPFYFFGGQNTASAPTTVASATNVPVTPKAPAVGANFPSQSVSTPAPGIVSNYNTNKKVMDITQKFQSYADTSTPQFPQGNLMQPQGTNGQTGQMNGQTSSQTSSSQFNAPSGSQLQDNGTYLYQGNYYTKDQLSSPENIAAINNSSLQKKGYDDALQSQLDAINKRFDTYKQQQQDITASGAAGVQNALLQSGAGGRGSVAQYAAATSDQRVQGIMQEGNKALLELDSQRDQLLSAAKMAYQDKDYKRLGDLNSQIEQNRAEMVKMATEKNKAISASIEQARKDQAISQAYEASGNDPIAILNSLKGQGINDISAKDITSTIETLTNQKGIDEIAQQIAKAGNDPSIIRGARSVSEAIDRAGASLRTASNEVVKVGSSAYLIDKNTGKVVKSFGQPMAAVLPSSGGVSGVVPAKEGAPNISKQAQNIVDLINKGAGTMDDFVKGTSISSQALRNEVIAGIAASGGKNAKEIQNIHTAKELIDEMMNEEDYTQFGYSARLGGQYTTGFGDMKTRAEQLNALLAKDNLGLLKGAMSDKDMQFIAAMSGGVGSENTISEGYAKQRMETIQANLQKKVAEIEQTKQQATQLSKGSMDDRTYVEKAVSRQQTPYDELVNATPDGSIPVVDNNTGEIGYVPIEEYNMFLYTKL